MLGLEFGLAAAVNVAAAGLVGAGVTILVGWWSTRELRKHIYESFDRQALLLELTAQGIPFELQIEEGTTRVTGFTVYDRDLVDESEQAPGEEE